MSKVPVYDQKGLREYFAIKVNGNDRIRYKATLDFCSRIVDIPVFTFPFNKARYLIAVIPSIFARSTLLVKERHSRNDVLKVDTSYADLLSKGSRHVPSRRRILDMLDAADAQNPLHRGQYDMNLEDCFDTFDGNVVWRIAVDWRRSLKSKPHLELVDGNLARIDADIHEFEFQEGLFREGCTVTRLIATFRIPQSLTDFCLFAHDPQREVISNFYPMDSIAAANVVNERSMRMQSVDDQQAVYEEWIDGHLKALADSEDSDDGLDGNFLHVVICALEHPQPDIDRSLESLRQQNRTTWRATILTANESVSARKNEHVSSIRVSSANKISEALRSIAKDAGTGHICIIEAGDTFARGALNRIAEAASDPRSVIIFDEDTVDENGIHSHPRFKSELNKQLAYTENWISYGAAFPAKLVDDMTENSDIASPALIAYALALAAIQKQLPFEHVPAVLLHTLLSSLEKRGARHGVFLLEESDIAKNLLSDHLAALGAHVIVEDGLLGGTLHIRLDDDANPGKVSIIIPTMDHADMLGRCVSSILEKATYENIEIVLVENNSREAETFALYDRLQKENLGIVKVVTWDGPFNYSAIINFGVAASSGEYLLLLNNDTEVIVPSFIEEMLALATIPEVGVVGAKLYFKDMLVQHAGMLIGPYGGISHVNQNFSDIRSGYQNRALTTSSFSSVTGACQMVRRDVFDEVGGYDDTFVVGFNDADFCLKVRDAGYDVVSTPYAELYHYEFVSRGREAIDDEKQTRWESERDAFFSKWKDALKNGDPLTNPNLDKDNWYYALPEAD